MWNSEGTISYYKHSISNVECRIEKQWIPAPPAAGKLYNVTYKDKKGKTNQWQVVSRKDEPIVNADEPDAVVIVPVIETQQGRRLVVTKEYRLPIGDFEYGFPAGLIEKDHSIEQMVAKELKEETGLDLVEIKHISNPVYSSPGMSDESCCMVIVKACGKVSDEYLDDSEQIETMLMGVEDIRELLSSKDKKVSAKAWGILYQFVRMGKIEL